MTNDSSRISRHEISTQIFQWCSHIFLLNVISSCVASVIFKWNIRFSREGIRSYVTKYTGAKYPDQVGKDVREHMITVNEVRDEMTISLWWRGANDIWSRVTSSDRSDVIDFILFKKRFKIYFLEKCCIWTLRIDFQIMREFVNSWIL